MYKLRELERKDLPLINNWKSDHNLISCLDAPYRYMNMDIDSGWLEALFEKDAFADIYVYSLLKEDYKSKYKYSEAEIVNFCITQITVKSEQEMILRYFKDAFSFDITEPEIFDSLSGKIHCNADFFMAYANGVLGYAAIYANNLENRTAYITLIAVEQNERRRGVGTALLHAFIDAAKEKNMKFLKLEVLNDNKEAIKFYIKNGFNYYGGCSKEERISCSKGKGLFQTGGGGKRN